MHHLGGLNEYTDHRWQDLLGLNLPVNDGRGSPVVTFDLVASIQRLTSMLVAVDGAHGDGYHPDQIKREFDIQNRSNCAWGAISGHQTVINVAAEYPIGSTPSHN